MSNSSETRKANGSNDPISNLNGLEAEITKISAFITQEAQVGNENADSNLRQLLEQLSSVDGVAKDVEDKLDNLLGNLDVLLASLEDKESSKDETSTSDNAKEDPSPKYEKHVD